MYAVAGGGGRRLISKLLGGIIVAERSGGAAEKTRARDRVRDLNLVGKTLGSYQIVEEIGRGGMAVVYRAYQPSLNRDVAIKVLPPQLTFDQRFVERFQREARAAAGLRHPHIIVVHDVGEQDGLYYIVMEYLEGQTLRQLVEREGPLAPDRAAGMIEQVASALDYAHQRGFVHRDVKPSNIFVREGDQATLTDFGIAKAARGTQLTGTGMLIGTPEYMSPEQAQGEEVGPSTDIYALGVMAYQMLTGRVPFRGTTPHATLHAVIYQPPVPPRQINPGLSPAIDTVLLKALAKQPEARFRTGAEMAAALQRAGSGEGVTVPPAGEVRPGPALTQRLRPRAPSYSSTRRGERIIWTPEEYDELARLAGEEAAKRVERLNLDKLEDPNWIPDERTIQRIRDAFSTARRNATDAMWVSRRAAVQ